MRAFFTLNGVGLAISSSGALRSLALPSSSGLTVQVTAEYVDESGVLQTATADSSTTPTITGVAPFKIWFDASGSRSVSTDADDEGGAWTNLGYHFDSGEGLAGTWSLTGEQKNTVSGAPCVGPVFTTAGTHTATYTVRDSEGRQSAVTFNVVISAPGTGTTINEGGSWPTWADDTVYRLAAGTDHTAKGEVDWSGRRGIRLVKDGAGADPLISELKFDDRYVVDSVLTRTRNCATWGINVPILRDAPVGHLYCSIVDSEGPLIWYPTSLDYYWTTEASTEVERNNICYNRGTAIWNVAEMNSNDTQYVFLGGGKNLTFRNVDLNKTTGSTNAHVFRGGSDGLDLMFNRFRSEVAVASYIKLHGWNNGTTGEPQPPPTLDDWPPNDRWGQFGVGQYLPVCRKIARIGNVFGAAGATAPTNNLEACPENNDGFVQAVELVTDQQNVWYATSWTGTFNLYSGRHIQFNDNKLNLGAGGEASAATGSDVGRLPTTPTGWDGPYVTTPRPTIV